VFEQDPYQNFKSLELHKHIFKVVIHFSFKIDQFNISLVK
jgi:hypothetical protein